VELNKNGHVSSASVIESSSYKRLDDAALAVVRTWRCNPAIRNGQPVRAVALQPFNFVLQGL
jgi:protein TonB